MTKFEKSAFNWDGMYLTYGPERRFVARFKHKPGMNKTGYVKFLMKHFTVEEYFAARDANTAPVCVMEAKGYVMAHILKWLKEGKLKDWKGFDYDHWAALNA